ncbi:hypothetical protein Baya_10510 [Bagarius yarrelli]|uniref:Uncharacterized protein n=1 Tax=Bagarius yarrelli TaxID=175774 RepID=A0A556UFQ2_BAGYA|nr:hypothetical protein Baya_10510 [Bagarius yarrelli]
MKHKLSSFSWSDSTMRFELEFQRGSLENNVFLDHWKLIVESRVAQSGTTLKKRHFLQIFSCNGVLAKNTYPTHSSQHCHSPRAAATRFDKTHKRATISVIQPSLPSPSIPSSPVKTQSLQQPSQYPAINSVPLAINSNLLVINSVYSNQLSQSSSHQLSPLAIKLISFSQSSQSSKLSPPATISVIQPSLNSVPFSHQLNPLSQSKTQSSSKPSQSSSHQLSPLSHQLNPLSHKLKLSPPATSSVLQPATHTSSNQLNPLSHKLSPPATISVIQRPPAINSVL